MSRRWVVTGIVVAGLTIGGATASVGSAARGHAATSCANLKASPTVRGKIAFAYQSTHRGSTRKQIGPVKGSLFYGVCGSTHWAIGEFTFADGQGMDDQPETFRQLSGAKWKDRGDDGSICAIPHTLTRLWGQYPLQHAICG